MTSQSAKVDPPVTQIVHATQSGTHDPSPVEIIVEEAVAIVFNGTTVAVMMATPNDLQDLAFGFALTEGYIRNLADIESFEVITHDTGIEAQFWVVQACEDIIQSRRRAIAGPVGCGLCGLDSLDQVKKPAISVGKAPSLSQVDICSAMESLFAWQPLKQRTRSTHAAGFYVPSQGIIEVREDVGRHNALDKLIGALARNDTDPSEGAFIMTSRISLELVQKCAFARSGMLIAASGPTSQAIALAKACNISLFGFCRGGSFTAY